MTDTVGPRPPHKEGALALPASVPLDSCWGSPVIEPNWKPKTGVGRVSLPG